jgi:putative flippase GtrA
MLTKRDYALVVFIGACFGLFAVPILRGINISFVKVGWTVGIGLVVFFGLFAALALAVAAYVSRWIPVVLRVAKFSAVGAFNTFFDWGILNMLIAMFDVPFGAGYAVAKGTSFTIASIGSYFWNKYWTFDAGRAKEVGKEVTTFIVVSVIGLLINVAVSSFIVNDVGHPALFTPQRWENVGAALATVVSLVWNFIGYKFVVFSSSAGKNEEK